MQVINFIILCSLLILTTLPARSNTSIGDVTLSKGNSIIDRKDGEKDVKVEKNLDIFSYDTVKTGKGQVAIEFLDETRVDITQSGVNDNMITLTTSGDNANIDIIQRD